MLSVSLSVCVDKLIDFAFKIEELYARQHIRVRAWHRVNIILSHFCRSWTNKTVQGCGYSTKCRSLNDTKDQRSQASFQKQERLHETIPCVRKKYHLHQATGNRHYLQGNTNVFFCENIVVRGVIFLQGVAYLWRNGIMISRNEKRERTTQDER